MTGAVERSIGKWRDGVLSFLVEVEVGTVDSSGTGRGGGSGSDPF